MPQLMPINWVLSVFMILFLFVMLFVIYVNLINLIYKKGSLNLIEVKFIWLW